MFTFKTKSDKVENVRLIMAASIKMPSSDRVVDENGKSSFKKNGKFDDMTKYLFKKSTGESFEITTKNNQFRTLEGELVDITFVIVYDEFKKKLGVKLFEIEKSKTA